MPSMGDGPREALLFKSDVVLPACSDGRGERDL